MIFFRKTSRSPFGAWRVVAAIGLLVIAASAAKADLRVPSLFADHMVLQRERPFILWGTAAARAVIVLEFRDQRQQVTADESGNWQVQFEPGKAGGPYELKLTGDGEVTLRDILVGDVWFCSGQSNMAMRVKQTLNAEAEIAAARDTAIRQFHAERWAADVPSDEVRGQWTVTSPETAGEYSATAYYFAREYRKVHPEVPIGIINSAWGGSPIQAWCSRALMSSDREYAEAIARWDENATKYEERLPKYRADLAAWPAKVKQAKAAGKQPPLQPQPPMGGAESIQYKPTGLYNAMVHPFLRLSVRGVLWYQGESNRGQADLYRRLFPAMIQEWRTGWKRPALPFFFVQLPNIGRDDPGGPLWPWLREAQAATLAVPGTGMVVSTDIGETTNEIHPANKQEIGRRLSLLVRRHLDGDKTAATFPRYAKLKISGKRAQVELATFGSRLRTRDEKSPTGFLIAGEDRVFYPANATLRGDVIELSSDAVKKPAAVRYAWSNLAEGNLVNTEGLPAAPFRTDTWPMSPAAATAK